jgi:FixJ family two-component response regulator
MKRGKPSSAPSNSYQYRILEIGIEINKLANYANEDGIANQIDQKHIDDRIIELNSELMLAIYDLFPMLSDYQQKILNMQLSGKTQNEIAKELNVSQSAVHKNMFGNIDYKKNKKRYGGSVRRLAKLAKKSEKIQSILTRIDMIKHEEK